METATLKVELRGKVPLILHNGHLADPLNPFAKRLKEVSGKRKKTDSDYEAMSRIEWEGGLYFASDGESLIVPGELIQAMLSEAAKIQRLGKAFKAGVYVDGDSTLIHDGPKSVDEMYADSRFVSKKLVKVKLARIVRTRPIFEKWSITVEVKYVPDVVNEKDVLMALGSAGSVVGLGDWRPRYGRFDVVKA